MRFAPTATAVGFGRSVATTALFNVAAAAISGVAGVVIARALGPTGRGEYAAIMVWFGVVLAIGQLGQTSATTYFVAKEPVRAPDYLATSRNMMVASGTVALVAGILATPLLAADNPALASGYRLMFATCLAAFVGASYTFSLQSVDIAQWNLARMLQPILFLAAIMALLLLARLSLAAVLWTLTITICAQTAFAYLLCRRQSLTHGRGSLSLARPLARYGMSQLAASAPALMTARLDQLVLSLTVVPAVLGHYAVAVSLTALAIPVVSAIGNVSFPRIASRVLTRQGTARLQWWAVLLSGGIGLIFMVVLACSATWLVPAVFGSDYRDAVPLLWLLAPGGVFLSCEQVCGDLLRGHGRPLDVAKAAAVSAVVTVGLLVTLLPLIGPPGAAIASSVAAGVSLLIMLRKLRKIVHQGPPHRGGSGDGDGDGEGDPDQTERSRSAHVKNAY